MRSRNHYYFHPDNKLSLIHRSMSGEGRQILEIANGDRTVWLIIRLFGSPEHLQFTSGSTIGSTSFGVVPSFPRLLRCFVSSLSLFIPFSLAFTLSPLSLSLLLTFFLPFSSFFFHLRFVPVTRLYHLPISSWDDSAFPLSRNCCHPADEGTNPRRGFSFS